MKKFYFVLVASELIVSAIIWHKWGWQALAVTFVLCVLTGSRHTLGNKIKIFRRHS